MSEQELKYRLSALPAGAVSPARLEYEINNAESGILTQVQSIAVTDTDLVVTFKAQLTPAEQTVFDADAVPDPDGFVSATIATGSILGDHSGIPLPDENVTPLGNPVFALEQSQADAARVAIVEAVGSETIYATHDFCTPSSWYSTSKRVTGAVPTVIPNSGGRKWRLPHRQITDLTSGLVFDEEGIIEDQAIFEPADPHGYSVEVRQDGVPLVQRARFASEQIDQGPMYDYELDYEEGVLIFGTDHTGASLEADYSHTDVETYDLMSGELGPSTWILRPLPDKTLQIARAEIQFARNIEFNQTMTMQTVGYAQFFAPHLLAPPYNLPANTLIPLETTVYKTMNQVVDEAVNADAGSVVPASSENTDRGFTQDRLIFPFRYGRRKPIYAVLGMEVRIWLDRHTPFGGERATASFYMSSKTETDPMAALSVLLTEG